jgi:hypothetical protein
MVTVVVSESEWSLRAAFVHCSLDFGPELGLLWLLKELECMCACKIILLPSHIFWPLEQGSIDATSCSPARPRCHVPLI